MWNTEAGGNHDWVEIWDGGFWSFTGPTEYTEKVDCPVNNQPWGFHAMHTHLQRFTSIRNSGKMQAEWKLAEKHVQCCLCRG